jgi:deoxyribonuclease-4
MRIGSHLRTVDADGTDVNPPADPIEQAAALGLEAVQFFLTDPKGWSTPKVPAYAEKLAAAAASLDVFIHAPYIINVASSNNRIRIPSRKAVLNQTAVAAQLGAKGVVVHGGHVLKDEDPQVGIENWLKLFERQVADGGFAVPVLIENTAGGSNAMARELDMLGRLWERIGEFGPGFVLDTCHAFAAGWELDVIVDKVKAITGRIDLVHLNNSQDEFGSSRDRHANLGSGTIDPQVLVDVVSSAGAPVILETPSAGVSADLAYLRENLS